MARSASRFRGTYKLTTAPASGSSSNDDPATGDLDIEGLNGAPAPQITTAGQGADVTTIDANSIDRAFTIHSGASLTVSGMTIEHGAPTTHTASTNDGGAVLAEGNVTVRASVLDDNTALGQGGAIDADGGNVTVLDTAVSGNQAPTAGGGIASGGTGVITLIDDTFDGNQATGMVGAGGAGGALAYQSAAGPGSVINNVTIAHNTAPLGGGVFGPSYARTIENSIVADNSDTGAMSGAAGCFDSAVHENGPDESAGADAGGNPDSDGTCFSSTFASDRTSVDPKLGMLSDNDGTPTDPLLAGSPAIFLSLAASCTTSDQRDVARRGDGCDSGAYQAQSADLGVTVQAPATSPTDTAITDTFTVTNAGPYPATMVTFTDPVPLGAVGLAAASQDSCTAAATLTCAIVTLAASQSATITIALAPSGSGTLANTAMVSTTALDSDAADDSATATTVVTATATATVPTGTSARTGLTSPTSGTATTGATRPALPVEVLPGSGVTPPGYSATAPPTPPLTVGVARPVGTEVYVQFICPADAPSPACGYTTGEEVSGTPTQIGVYDSTNATWSLQGESQKPFTFGLPAGTIPGATTVGAGEVPVTGDWDGDGLTGIGVVDPVNDTWSLRNALGAGFPQIGPFMFGTPGSGEVPVTGDWRADRTDVGEFDPATATWHLGATPGSAGAALDPFQFGDPSGDDIPVTGNFTGLDPNGCGVFDPKTATWTLLVDLNSNTYGTPHGINVPGPTNVCEVLPIGFGAEVCVPSGWVTGSFHFGDPGAGEIPIVGDWDGTGITGIGVFDPTSDIIRVRSLASNGPADPGGTIRLTKPPAGTLIPVTGTWPAVSGETAMDASAVGHAIKPITVGVARGTLSRGHHRTVKLALNVAGRRLLAKNDTLKVTIVTIVTRVNGGIPVSVRTIVLHTPARRRHTPPASRKRRRH